MATWQLALHLVPRAVSPSDRDPWRLRQPAGTWRRALGALLPRGTSWSPQLGVWGTEAGHRIEVWEHDGRVESILVRIDAREPIERLAPFCQELAAFAQAQGDVVFISAPGAVLEPTATALSEAIAASEAWRSVHHRDALIKARCSTT
ncbi:MAG TPA: hypothetical protein VFU46_10560 [Gemmatimonadales bacterium]|nr:hypothetical protein [Gemmatimonadales bacterium]